MTPTDVAEADGALFGVLPETIAQRARPSVIVVKTREQISHQLFEKRAAQAELLEAADKAAEQGRSVRRHASIAGSPSRTTTTASSPISIDWSR